jgi:hypothetical protein
MKFAILFSLSFFVYTINAQKVGVGTTNPSDALHVEANANSNALRVRIDGQTKLRVLANGGVTIGQNNAGTAADGLYVHGNTGLGIDDPTEKLVVNGNVDVLGEIKADGIAGEEGQFLTPDGNGNMVWENLSDCRFTNARQYGNGSSGTWIVPADVTLIKVELWGAGGSGGPPGGGGAGGYVCGFMKTTPGESFSIEVGDNGSGSSDSRIYKTANPPTALVARGGQDVTSTSPGYGGSFAIINSFNIGAFGKKGESGSATTIVYSQKSSTEFMESTQYGDGGAAYNGFGSAGSFILKNTNTGAKIVDYRGRSGSDGSGGSGDENVNVGVDGYVIIRW